MSKISKTGLCLFAIYVLGASVLFAMVSNSKDVKSAFVFKQIAVAPAMVFGDMLNLQDVIYKTSWLNNFSIMAVISAVLVYALGHMLGLIGHLLRRKFSGD